jgi:biopolymer transport protein TolQ
MWQSALGRLIFSSQMVEPLTLPRPQESILDMMISTSPVVQLVLLLLVGFSIASWAIIFNKRTQMRRAERQSDRFIEIFWDAKNLAAINTASLDLKASPVAHVFRAGYQELVRITRAKRQESGDDLSTDLGGVANVERAMKRAASQEITRLERSLTFLATTASAAPFVGLFGTVWGIMNAFRGLSVTQSSSIQAVAPGISEALIATAIGLAAAIPAVIAYNHFAGRVRVLSAEMDNFASEFLNIADRHFLKR